MRSALIAVFALVFVVACGDDSNNNMNPDGGVDAPDGGPEETVCEELPALTSGATCEVTTGGETKLIKGNILTPQMVFRGGQVAFDAGGVITCVGCDCTAGGETTIVCPGASVSPGLINTHDHITFTQNNPYTPPVVGGVPVRYEHRHQWRKGQDGKPKIPAPGGASGVRISWGELRFVMGGATSIVGSGGQAGLLRNLDSSTQQEGLNHTAVDFDTFPLGDSGGTRRTADCDYGGTVTPESLMNVKSFEPHTAEGTDLSANNEFKCESSSDYDKVGAPKVSQDLLLSKTALIHAIGLTTADYAAMAEKGTGLIWSPRSNITLYGDTARVTTAASFGVEIALGTDWMPTGSMNLLRELRCADEMNSTYYDHYFSDKQLWEMVTVNAASVTAMDDAIGLLAPNHVADIAIFKGNGKGSYRAVLEAEPKDVALVLRSGNALYGDDTTIAGLTTSCDTVDVCGVQKRVCTKREIGKSWDELVTAVGSIYPAFECGVPQNEPSCVPLRPAAVNGSTVYTGVVSGSDSDGDGIDDSQDNCPKLFNPVRPMDNMVQSDLDSDGAGDACDVCPNDPNTTTCTQINPNDRDHDGFINTADNCPDAANPQQSDGDSDGKGDACDPCPSDANPGTSGCPTSIYKIKNGMTPPGSTVRLDNALVTGKGTNGFFVQAKMGDAGYAGSDYSGLFVYTGAMAPTLAAAVRGMRVSIDGTVTLFNGQIELDQVGSVMATTLVAELAPQPVAVTYAEVKTGGTRATQLESVLVSLGSSSITAVDTMFGEYTLTSGSDTLVVDDFLYVTPGVAIGGNVTSIKGILTLRQMASKLEPRDTFDVGGGTPTLAAFGPALSYVRQGSSGVSTFPAGSELTVTLSAPAQGNTAVSISSNNGAITIPGGTVTVQNGMTTATVLVNSGSPNSDVTLTAQLGAGTPLTAHVRVLATAEAPTTVAISPTSAAVAPAGSVTLTVTLNIPAPAGGTAVTLAVAPSNAGTTNPANTVTVAANELAATFTYTDTIGTGTSTVTASLGGASPSVCTLTVSQGASHLVINEVDYDQFNDDTAEFVEIFNPTGAAISLNNVALVLINGSTLEAYPTSTSVIDLSSLGSVAAGGYVVLAGANIAPAAGALKLDPGWTLNQVQNGSPDGIALVDTSTNTLIDALSYEGSVTMAEVPGIANPISLVEGTVLSGAVVDINTGNASLCRSPNGKDTDNANADWKLCTTLTAGSANP
jgi:hypothetical protein